MQVNFSKNLFYKCLILFAFHLIISSESYKVDSGNGCFEKWLEGYRLASGHPQRTFTSVTLDRCQNECERERSCVAIAYGVSGPSNGTCELGVRSGRDSRSVGNLSLPYDEITKAPTYDIYLMSSHCMQRQPLFSSGSSLAVLPPSGNSVPIDCFYRLMSGKRLAKNHVYRAVNVHGLQECQEACISDTNCRSISYRYMVSGYTYNVANCELSPFYIVNYEESSRQKYDFVDDYDYDYFQREPHCKTTSRLGSFGVCALVVRKGAKLAPNLIKTTHQTSTATQCEFMCQTASRFRCRAFSIRHTTRGRDPFHSENSYESSCTLYETDISRLSQYELVSDPDYDLYELGRLMGAECVLQDQFLTKRPTGFNQGSLYPQRDPLLPPHSRYPVSEARPPTGYYPPPLPPRPHMDYDYHSRRPTGPGSSYLPESKIEPSFPRPACLVKVKQDFFLAPEITRAQFPTKSLEECRIECLRSLEVLRFPCRVLSFRLTSSSGGSCGLSEYYEQDLRSADFIPSRDRYEGGVIYSYDERDALCRRDERYSGTNLPTGSNYGGSYSGSNYGGSNYDRGSYGGSSSFVGGSSVSRYPTGGSDRYYPYPQQSTGSYLPDNRYPSSGFGSATVVDYGRPIGGSFSYDRDRTREKYPYDKYPNEGRETYYDRNRIYGQGSSSGQYFGSSSTYPNQLATTNEAQTYTVNGEKCLRQCSQDREGGFYYCVVDTRGTWDFCCRPDHYCGYSRGLSTPWCYVGSGPTSQVWRSCNHRLLSESPHPPIAYLHEKPPPKLAALSTLEVAKLSKDNALQLLKNEGAKGSLSSDFENLDGEVSLSEIKTSLSSTAKLNTKNEGEKYEKKDNVTDVGNEGSRQSKRLKNQKPSFTLVEVTEKNSKVF